MGAPQLVERNGVLAELRHTLAQTPRSGGRMVLLTGSAGIGRTSVVRALAAEAAAGPRHELFAAFLDELGRRHTLVVIEDVHWADAATADLPLYAGRRVEKTKALVVVTYREENVGPAHPVRVALEALATARGMLRRNLEPLSLAGVAELVGEREVQVDRLHRNAGGNPFFVTEVLAAPGWAASWNCARS